MLFGKKFSIFISAAAGLAQFLSAQNEHFQLFNDGFGTPLPYYKVDGSDGTIAAEIADGKLYTVGNGSVRIYDISAPKAPKLLGKLENVGNLRQISVRGKYLYAAARASGFFVIDISDPTSPKLAAHFDPVEMATGLYVAGNVAFIGHRVYGVQSVDISDPLNPRHIGTLKTDESQSVFYKDGLLFNGDWASGEIKIFDAKNPADIRFVSAAVLDGFGDGFCVSGNTLFAATGHHLRDKSLPPEKRYAEGHGLNIFDISDIKNPKKLSFCRLPHFYMGPSDFWSARTVGDFCIVNDTANGVFVFNVYDLKNPKLISNLKLPTFDGKINDPVGGVAIGDGVLYICGEHTGLYIAELAGIAKIEQEKMSNPPAPSAPDFSEKGFLSSGSTPRAPVRAAAVFGDFVYAACAADGIKLFKLSDRSVDFVRKFDIPFASDVKIRNGLLYCAERKNGVGIYKILPDLNLKEIGRIAHIDEKNLYDEAHYVWAPGGIGIIAVSICQGRIYFADASDPSKPRIISSAPAFTMMYGDNAASQIVGGKYFMINSFNGFAVYDLSAKPAPKVVFKQNYRSSAQGVNTAKFGDKFLVTKYGGWATINPADPKAVRELGLSPFPNGDPMIPFLSENQVLSAPVCGETQKSRMDGLVSVEGSSAAVASRMYRNIRVYDFSDIKNPKLLRSYELKNHPNAASFWKGRLVVPCGYSGLLLEKSSE